ncbi:hypothetical protein EV1_004829 [Malus domestica]
MPTSFTQIITMLRCTYIILQNNLDLSGELRKRAVEEEGHTITTHRSGQCGTPQASVLIENPAEFIN